MGVLVGHCLDMDAPPPYQPLVEQLEQAARGLAPEAFREVLGENAPEVARLHARAAPHLRRHRRVARRSRPTRSAATCCTGSGGSSSAPALRRPLVLCFEDLHWADESSLLLITALAQIAGELPLLLVGSYRPGDVGPRARALADAART